MNAHSAAGAECERPSTRPVPLGVRHETEAAGTLITWYETGAGDPLVLLHGLGDSHRTWRRLAPRLSGDFRILMPDLPGHGDSGRPDAPYTLDWYSDILRAWMEAIDLPRAHLCGHSYGGGVAQWMVLRHREKVDRLALVASGGLGHEVAIGLRLAALPRLEFIFTPAAMRLGSRVALALAPHTFAEPEPEEVEEITRMAALPGTGRAFRRTVRGVIDFLGQYMQTCNQVGAVRNLPAVAIFWGDSDPIMPASHGRAALQRFQGSTLSVYPDCGHFPHLQQAERLAEELRAFLRDPAREPVRIHFACPGGPRSTGPDSLPIARCPDCTFRTFHTRVRTVLGG